MVQVKNISAGPRGAYLNSVYVEAVVGEVIEADDYADEWFAVIEAEAEDAPAIDKMTVAELKDFAELNGIDLGDETKKDDILSAIELALEAKD